MEKRDLLTERLIRALERNTAIMERLLRAQGEEGDDIVCPTCSCSEIGNTSTMGHPRLTCYGCGGSWTPEFEGVEV